MTVWEIDIRPVAGQPDREAARVATDAAEMGLVHNLEVRALRGFLLQCNADQKQLESVVADLLVDPVTEEMVLGKTGDQGFVQPPWENAVLLHVLPLPGVMDPVADSTELALRRRGLEIAHVRTFRKYWLRNIESEQLDRLTQRLLANPSVEQVISGPLQCDRLDVDVSYRFARHEVPIRSMQQDDQLMRLSLKGQLYLSLAEMITIREHFAALGRDPSDVELETVAQTWSEHCSHKTLAGRIAYTDEHGTQHFENMLKETIFAATQEIRGRLGDQDWCLSVFEDNAGVVEFDGDACVTFKVETHNHPSALEPYGGANTGLGGVLRDTLGTGLGAKPVASTDVFCFAPPNVDAQALPAGVLHPRRVMKGVVAGVRDYGNRMGIPTVNGAVYFDQRYLGNPLVYCGSVGLMPRDAIKKEARPGDLVVTLGGRTGRDGIHGATFSSAELTSESETISGGAVQIGNAITEKMLMDVLLVARDRRLFTAVTDCGAGGYSSAVGEMGEKLGAEVWLEKIPIKYSGLSYTEIWISEAQERMVLSVPEEHWEALQTLCASESVDAHVIGRFTDTRRLVLKYEEHQVADLSMQFLHDGRPPVVRDAVYRPTPAQPLSASPATAADNSRDEILRRLLSSWNIASKHWIIRQYDHEVQGGSVVKPLVGLDGPSDAAVIRPCLDSHRGLVLACGMNPYFGDFDPYHMAACAIDEAVRNCVAVGADPSRIAILDNFCWGNTEHPDTLGSLVRAALACRDVALEFGTPFISGKDSLNNEFAFEDEQGQRQTIAIPPSLLISALGQVADIRTCVTMDAKQPGNDIFLLGQTTNAFGGSHYSLVQGHSGGHVPRVDAAAARRLFGTMHSAIRDGLLRACHDLSEGGLAVAAAEMAFSGGLGLHLDLDAATQALPATEAQLAPHDVLLFSESPSRFLCEVRPQDRDAFVQAMRDMPCCHVGQVTADQQLRITHQGGTLIDQPIQALRQTWRSPLDLE